MGAFNSQLGIAQSYYAATATPPLETTRLTGAATADVAVVGAGCTGLAAALAAARAGYSVIVLEGGEIGWGASGRNGGQIIPGLRMSAFDLVRKYGADHARKLFDLATSARDAVVKLIQDEGIECDLRLTGHLTGAIRESDMPGLEQEVRCMREVMDYPHASIIDHAAMQQEVARPYVGGMLDMGGGHMHPLNYTLGLAKAVIAAGARIHSNSAAIELSRSSVETKIQTEHGYIKAKYVILAGDSLLGDLDRNISRYIMPIANYIATTSPLPEEITLIRNDRAVSDTKFVVNYYRMTADGRLLFGGGERYTTSPPADMAAFVRPFLEKNFPQISGITIDHAWGGLVSVTRTRLPHLGRNGPVLWAHGYSGMGTILSTLAGRLLADAIDGDSRGLDLFRSINPPPFPGGTALRGPLHTLAMLWFSMRDRIGL
ncbi:FAD-binding oxidoreductase [Sphingobium sp. HBC34]|uniref:FAD-binding oxidoreductase n=1 Tax=Sphingobium cyanobacteriorum TaxID=3063954 RepID=A0ABT8ZTS9_9SPHN|nr:FAD-binding oxidoreductase [Sphingobium sp. HBC34]MDO7837384.1 FAD-binding oxidoreductase [Sphingobium sp. HBC34]